MIPMDYLAGSFEFDTDISRDDKGNYVASAMGYKAVHPDQSQALNNLNFQLNDAMEKGELIPNQG